MAFTLTFHPTKPFFYFHLPAKDPNDIYKKVSDLTSYQDPNANRTRAYKDGRWDGRHRLLRPTSKGFMLPNGMYSYVKALLMKYGEVRTEGLPKEPPRKHMWVWHGPQLRQHQVDGFAKTIRFLKSEPGCCVAMPTGSGKTTMACKIIQHYGVKTVIGVYTKELKEQWKAAIEANLHVTPSIFAGNKRSLGDITVVMLKTLSNAIKKGEIDLSDVDLFIVDEAHGSPAKTVYDVSMAMNPRYKIGLTATPGGRADGADKKIYAATGAVLEITSIDTLIERGHLAEPTFLFFNAPYYGYSQFKWQEMYKAEIVENTQRNRLIASVAKKFTDRGVSVYINVVNKSHGRNLSTLIPDGVFIHSESPNRSDAISKFKKRQLSCLITTDILKEGVDIPEMDAIIMAGGMKGNIPTAQKIGRVLRPGRAFVVDFIDRGKITSKHSAARLDIYRKLFGNERVDKGLRRLERG